MTTDWDEAGEIEMEPKLNLRPLENVLALVETRGQKQRRFSMFE